MSTGIPVSTLPQAPSAEHYVGVVKRADGVYDTHLVPASSLVEETRAALLPEVEGAAAGLVQTTSWASLAALAGSRAGQPGLVTAADAGWHTDPVVGGSVRSAGRYAWSTAPAGWRRIGDLDAMIRYAGDLGGAAAAMTASVTDFADADGAMIIARATASNAASATLSVNGGAAGAVLDAMGAALGAGQMIAGGYYALTRVGTAWRLLSWPSIGLRSYWTISPAGDGAAYTATLTEGAVVAGKTVVAIRFPIANTGAATLSINAAAALPMLDRQERPLTAGVIVAGATHLVLMTATAAILLTAAGRDMTTPIAMYAGDLGGSASAMTATVAQYVDVDGATIIARATASNAASATLAVNGGAARPIYDNAGFGLAKGAIGAGVYIAMTRLGGGWRMLSAPTTGMRLVRGTAPALAGAALSVTIVDGAPSPWTTMLSVIMPATAPAGATLSVNGETALPILDRAGRPIRAGVLTAGSMHLIALAATAAYALTGDGASTADPVRLAQAQARERSVGRWTLAEAGREREPIILTGTGYAHWTASTGDKDRVVQVYGAREIDLRHLPVSAGSLLTLWVAPAATAKLITDGKIYTATGGAGGQVVHVYHPEASTWSWSGVVTEESDALSPPTARSKSFITGGQSLARRWLSGAGMHGLQRGLVDYLAASPSIWAINGAQGGSGLVPYSNTTNYWWDPGTAQPGPAALAWKAALDARPSTQPAPSWVYWAFGQTDAQKIGLDATMTLAAYKSSCQALFAWMRTQIGSATCPIIISPLGAWDAPYGLTDAQATAVRWVELQLAAEGTAIYVGPQYFDLDRPSDDVHLTEAGQVIQGYRLAAHVAKVAYARTTPLTDLGPHVETISDTLGGARYRLLIRSAYGLDYDALRTDMIALLPAGADVLTGAPLDIARHEWTQVNAATWYLDIWPATPASGATVVWPYGVLAEARAGRYPRAIRPGPATAYGNYWPLQPIMRGTG